MLFLGPTYKNHIIIYSLRMSRAGFIATPPSSLIKMATFDETEGFEYVIVRSDKGGPLDLVSYLLRRNDDTQIDFLQSSSEQHLPDHRWIIFVSVVVRKIITFFAKPLEFTGYLVEFLLNLISLNTSLFRLILNVFTGKVVIPERGSESFVSMIGHLDGRIDLYNAGDYGDLVFELGNRGLMDLCIMASKLAYENARVVRNVVVQHWKMHFVDFFNCWNEFQKQRSTQVFMLCDKPVDANLILISFRGTEPFDADDWCTDFDYSWYEFPRLGKVHMGFLEALGLGNRENVDSFQSNLLMKNPTGSLEGSKQEQSGTDYVPPETGEFSAYYTVREKLKDLLREHKNAKFIVTGHSLGGALAILFPTVLVAQEENEIMQRLLGVYTFGQPRVGNRQLGRFMEAHLDSPQPRYFRVVYCNDLVPRLPYDDKTFLFKHFGECLYYNSSYVEQKMGEEPNPNFFGLRFQVLMYMNAVWELFQSLTMRYTYGAEYKEGWFCTLVRITGLVLPGISSHCPPNYVNSIRLGRERNVQMSAL